MEPITWGLIFSSILGGIIGNRADAGFMRAWDAGTKSLVSRLRQGDRYINDELEKAVRRSFLRALQTIASDSLEQLTDGFKKYRGAYVCSPENRKDVAWLENYLNNIEKQIVRLNNDNPTNTPLESIEEIELLVTPDGILNETLIEEAKQKLLETATQDSTTIGIYRQIAEESLVKRICLFFTYEIKSNSAVRDIFQTQLLAKANQILERQALTLENMQLALQNIANSLTHLLSKLNFLETALKELGYSQEKQFSEVTTILINNAVNLKDIKALGSFD